MNTNTNSVVALAHLRLSVTNLIDAVAFFEAIGARADTQRKNFTVVELRDRTRLQLIQSKEAVATGSALQFDFKVDDIDAAWRDYQSKGLKPSKIVRHTPGHDSFVLVGPDAYEVKVNSGFNRA